MRTDTQIKFLYYPLPVILFATKILKKHLLIKMSIKKLSEYNFRQLKYHQLKIRSKTGIWIEITLNVLNCLIVCLVPLKLLYTLATAPYLFILVGIPCVYEFAMVPGVYILLFPQEEKVQSSSYTFSCTIIKKI